MRKTLMTVGNSIGIIFNKEEQKNYHLNIGDVLELKFYKVRVEKK